MQEVYARNEGLLKAGHGHRAAWRIKAREGALRRFSFDSSGRRNRIGLSVNLDGVRHSMDVSGLHQKAKAAMEKRNFAYAVEMFLQCLALQPEFLEARRDLRATSLRWQQERGKAGLSAMVKNAIGSLKAFIAASLFKDYEKAILNLDRCLADDPENMGLLKKLGTLAIRGGFLGTAVLCLEEVTEKKPQDVSAWRLLGSAQEATGNIPMALEAFEKVKELKPADADAHRKVKYLMAKQAMDKGKYDGDYRRSIKDETQAQHLEQAARVIRDDQDVQNAIEAIRAELAEHPDNVRLILKLGDLHVREGDFDEAGTAYAKAQELDAADFTIQVKIGDLQIAKYDRTIKEFQVKAGAGDAAAKQSLGKVQAEKQSFMLAEFAKRVKGQPTNASYHFQYGTLLYNARRHQDAVSEFQYTVGDPRYRIRSHNCLGLCFGALGQVDLAEKQFRAGLADMDIVGDQHKPVIYNLGSLLENAGRLEEAREEFSRLYEVDIKYKDTAARLQRITEQLGG